MIPLYIDLDATKEIQDQQATRLAELDELYRQERVAYRAEEKARKEREKASLKDLEGRVYLHNQISEEQVHLIDDYDMRLLKRTKEFLGDE